VSIYSFVDDKNLVRGATARLLNTLLSVMKDTQEFFARHVKRVFREVETMHAQNVQRIKFLTLFKFQDS